MISAGGTTSSASASQHSRPGHGPRRRELRSRRLLKNRLSALVEQCHTAGEQPVELWAMDEHQVGLKPILRRVWARRGHRPAVRVRPRYEWLYVYGFVQPKTGETEFWLAPGVGTETFRSILEVFIRRRGTPELLVLDQAGWHVSRKNRHSEAEETLEFVYLPTYSPDLQPAEHLWKLCDEVIANRVFSDIKALEEALAERCACLSDAQELIRRSTLFRWWPRGADHSRTM